MRIYSPPEYNTVSILEEIGDDGRTYFLWCITPTLDSDSVPRHTNGTRWPTMESASRDAHRWAKTAGVKVPPHYAFEE